MSTPHVLLIVWRDLDHLNIPETIILIRYKHDIMLVRPHENIRGLGKTLVLQREWYKLYEDSEVHHISKTPTGSVVSDKLGYLIQGTDQIIESCLSHKEDCMAMPDSLFGIDK